MIRRGSVDLLPVSESPYIPGVLTQMRSDIVDATPEMLEPKIPLGGRARRPDPSSVRRMDMSPVARAEGEVMGVLPVIVRYPCHRCGRTIGSTGYMPGQVPHLCVL